MHVLYWYVSNSVGQVPKHLHCTCFTAKNVFLIPSGREGNRTVCLRGVGYFKPLFVYWIGQFMCMGITPGWSVYINT